MCCPGDGGDGEGQGGPGDGEGEAYVPRPTTSRSRKFGGKASADEDAACLENLFGELVAESSTPPFAVAAASSFSGYCHEPWDPPGGPTRVRGVNEFSPDTGLEEGYAFLRSNLSRREKTPTAATRGTASYCHDDFREILTGGTTSITLSGARWSATSSCCTT